MGKPQKAKEDPRFASSLYDPRFIVPSLKKNKIKVDDRFSKEELKKLNITATGRKVKVDRYGRKVKKDAVDEYDKYFEEEKGSDEEEKSQQPEESEDSGSEGDSESASEEEEELPKAERKRLSKPKEAEDSEKSGTESESKSGSESDSDSDAESGEFLDRARGEGLQSDSSDSESESEAELESEIEEEEKPEEGEPSATFAVVNLDWDNVRAVDLMATFASFVPKGGAIRNVTIYPSEFGKEQMQKEEIEGPPKELFKTKKIIDLDSESDDELDLTNKEDLEKAARKLYEEDDGEEDYDSKALRKYQLQRLRYYYAVVLCDSVGTAKNIYDNCDGSEYESTANIFDLRYVPEGMEFDDSDAKDVCTKIPSSYRPDSTFVTDALQHSKVKLTWDETPKERLTLSTRLFSQKEIDDMDFKAYLASDSEGSDGEVNGDLKSKYQNLLGGKFSFDKGAEDDEGDVDMEITFNPGLDENKPAPEPKAEEETTIGAYKRKEKERRARRMEKYKSQVAAEEEEKKAEKGDKKKNKKGRKHDDESSEKSKAELELLMLDEDNNKDNADHFNMRDIVKAEKRKGKKKGKKNYDSELVQDTFSADLNDPRFKEVFENHEYAIDPTSSEFKKTQTMKNILQERSKRLRRDDGRKNKKVKTQRLDESSSSLNNLVEKLKQKGRK